MLTRNNVRQFTKKIIFGQEIADVHSHMTPEEWKELLLISFCDLLLYHYIIQEFCQYLNKKLYPNLGIPEGWDEKKVDSIVRMPQDSPERIKLAKLVWEILFVKYLPTSAATRGVIEILKAMDISLAGMDFDEIKKDFDKGSISDRLDVAFKLSGTAFTVMTNDPWNTLESCLLYTSPSPRDQRGSRMPSSA